MIEQKAKEPMVLNAEGAAAPGPLLERVEAPVARADIALVSGRRYELSAEEGGDRLTVRGRDGQVELRITLTEAGPVLSFSGAELELSATKSIKMQAPSVQIAGGEIQLQSDGDIIEKIGGHHHTQVEGEERLEAGAVQMQSNRGAISVKAMHQIELDGEHIGLNDDPAPEPFGWSSLGKKIDR